jgi:ABC-type uncharacterized transport system permease subunit
MQHFKRYSFIFLGLVSLALLAHSYSASLSHILISIIACAILGAAALQASVITVQTYVLKHYPMNTFPILRILPPVQSMQAALFKVLWAGFIFLSLSFAGAFLYLPNVLQTIQISKLALCSLAWGLFATLLYGYHRSGWRNDVITTRTLIGVLLLTAAYFGSKWIE